jgi:hypothetical protein
MNVENIAPNFDPNKDGEQGAHGNRHLPSGQTAGDGRTQSTGSSIHRRQPGRRGGNNQVHDY